MFFRNAVSYESIIPNVPMEFCPTPEGNEMCLKANVLNSSIVCAYVSAENRNNLNLPYPVGHNCICMSHWRYLANKAKYLKTIFALFFLLKVKLYQYWGGQRIGVRFNLLKPYTIVS